MTKAEKLKLLQEWQKVNADVDRVQGLLDSVIGPNDGPLKHSVYTMQATYTRAIELIVGDMWHWCEWYALENDFGSKGLSARAVPGRPMRKINTLEKLLTLIEASNAKG